MIALNVGDDSLNHAPLLDYKRQNSVTVHSRVNHYADWHGGCTFYLEWRDALLVTGTVNSNTVFFYSSQ